MEWGFRRSDFTFLSLILCRIIKSASNLFYGSTERICEENISPSALTKVRVRFFFLGQTLLTKNNKRILLNNCFHSAVPRFLFIVCFLLLSVVCQAILHPCCMETLLSLCITAPISFPLAAPPPRTTCGTYLEDSVSLCFIGK